MFYTLIYNTYASLESFQHLCHVFTTRPMPRRIIYDCVLRYELKYPCHIHNKKKIKTNEGIAIVKKKKRLQQYDAKIGLYFNTLYFNSLLISINSYHNIIQTFKICRPITILKFSCRYILNILNIANTTITFT